jgi:lipopolysaccharide/colanic/teichoic acid biosynthesis glycosyltransferase
LCRATFGGPGGKDPRIKMNLMELYISPDVTGLLDVSTDTNAIPKKEPIPDREAEPVELRQMPLNDSGAPSIAELEASPRFPLFLKARVDFVFSIAGILLLLPVFLIIGMIIKLSSRGPVFFLQERMGFMGSKFKMIKFRTMVLNSEGQLEPLKSSNEASGPVFKMKDDPRITPFGKFLRRNGLDELPQLFNVVKGEMSLIGPRPPLEDEVKQYEPWQLRRLSVKPGITCTWQITPNRHDVPFDQWMKMDLHYIDNWNFRDDVVLFFRTVKTFFMGGGH